MYNASLVILNKINDSGFKAYVVGGFVRDLYLNRHSIDVDICTNATPKELKDIFGTAMLPSVNYGSVTITYKKIRFEITTFRKDIKYENNRLPVKIKYIDSLIDDLKRRDFTINTLCMDKNGEIIDLLGSKSDLDNGLIKMVGSPKHRLKEDSLRILRAIRFATILDFKIDDSLKKYIKKYGYLLKKLSYYRKREELEKIFTSDNVKYGISLLKELNLLKYLEIEKLEDVVIVPSLIGIWAQLDVGKIYDFSSADKTTIKNINELLKLDINNNSNLYKYGLYVSSIVGEIKGVSKKVITKRYNDLPIHSMGDIKMHGNDIKNILNINGIKIKGVLLNLETKILNNQLNNNYDCLKDYIISNYKDIQSKKNNI